MRLAFQGAQCKSISLRQRSILTINISLLVNLSGSFLLFLLRVKIGPVPVSHLHGSDVPVIGLEPGMVESIFDGHPLGRVFNQQLLDEVFAVGAYMLPHIFLKSWFRFNNFLKGVFNLFALERQSTTEHCVKNDPRGPDIDFFPIANLFKNFWGYICWCSARINQFLIL
jgi:hypothetical protein